MSDFFSENPLNSMNTLELLQRLERYKKTDLKRISDPDLFNLTLETLPALSIVYKNLNNGNKLYRVRRRKTSVLLTSKEDAWYPEPRYVTTRQRLNDVGKPLLYTSLDQATPFFESKAIIGESFAVFEYSIKEKESIQVTSIGMNESTPERFLNNQGEINNKIIEQFLHTEFTKDVGEGTEYLYRISNMLANNFYDIPHCDGYMYPSVAIGSGINVALKPNAVDSKLLLVRITNVIINDIEEGGRIGVNIEHQKKFEPYNS